MEQKHTSQKSANHIVEIGVVTKRPSDPALRGGMDHQLWLLIWISPIQQSYAENW